MLRIVAATLGFLSLAQAQAVPPKIQLQSRLNPRGPSLKRRALSPVNVPLEDFFLGTDLQWFGNMTIGTPPQTVPILFDTGSSTLEVASTLCDDCDNQIKFDVNKSSTFMYGGQTGIIVFDTGVGVEPVVGNNTALTLRSATDTVSIGGLSASNTSLLLITHQTPNFNIDPFSGIQGMSASAEGLFAALVNQGLPSLFSMYLTPKAVGNAELTVGGIDSTKFIGTPIFASNVGRDGTWELASPWIAVNGNSNSLLLKPRNITFDSGTSNVYFSQNTTEAIYALISPDIKPNPNEPGTYGIACDRISSLSAVIDITFTSQDGTPFNLTIPSSELSVGPFADDPSTCQTLINVLEGLDIVGGSLLKHSYSIWDVGGQRMGFAPAKLCLAEPYPDE